MTRLHRYTSIVDELNALGWQTQQTHMMRTGKRGRFDGASDGTIYSNPAYLIYLTTKRA